MTEPLYLNGLDGANPLGFLAALGTLTLCERLNLHPRMAWRPYANSYRPMLWVEQSGEVMELAELLNQRVQEDWCNEEEPVFIYNDIIACLPQDFRRRTVEFLRGNDVDRVLANLLAGFGSDAILQESGNQAGMIQPSALSFANRQSERKLLEDYAALVRGKRSKSKTYPPASAQVLLEALAKPWRYEDDHKELRWSPTELRQKAYSKSGKTVHGANLLAFWALTLLPSFPSMQGLLTTGVSRSKSNIRFTWPFWSDPLPVDVVRSLLASPLLHQDMPDLEQLRTCGVFAVHRSHRISFEKGLYFTPSFAV
jgi:hypothetical protein